MAPLVLEGDTLGKKHQHYNKLVKEAIAKKQTIETLSGEDDIHNLLQIDVACKTKNVDFVLEVLKSEDLLYASRAIKNSKWLITEKQYAHIVNPEYLHEQLAPHMTSKAFNKLMLNVRLNLKDEDRAQEFHKYIADRDLKAGYKWLPLCSVKFIENVIKKRDENIPNNIFLRLFEKSISIFEVFIKAEYYFNYNLTEKSTLIGSSDPERYLDVLDKMEHRSGVQFTPRMTKIFMKRCPNRILDKFEQYAKDLHLPTFAKQLKKKEDIKMFLLKHAQNEKLRWLYSYSHMQHFIKHLPKESKFEFVKTIFIDKEISTSPISPMFRCAQSCLAQNNYNQNTYQWYKFAPFDVAFTDLKKLIRAESSPPVRNMMLQVLLTCAGRNMKHVQAVLKYYQDKHINEPFKFKIQFVNKFISQYNTHEFDNATWSSLKQLFQSMEAYVESENNIQFCINAIIIRHVIRGEKVPEIINSKFTFDTLKEIKNKVKKKNEKDAVFAYLYKYMVAKNEKHKITTQAELGDAVAYCEKLMNLLNDWDKELQNYPYVLKRVRELITLKRENSWNTTMTSLYNINKSWKKVLFEESMSLCPTEGVCLNALKHDAGLLMRHKSVFDAMLRNDALLLTGLLRKARIYWSDSLAEELRKSYLDSLEKPGGRKALAMGLCALLSQKDLDDIAKKYAPTESKIDWNEIDELVISLQKQLAKNMAKARPLTALDTVLLYAKGDYLQYAVPSLNSILSQMSTNKSRQYIPTLLDAPVSLQKFGVRYAFDKLNSQELKPMFSEIWKSTKNSSIRTVLLTHTHALLCKEKNATHIKEIWDLLSMFIDNLSAEENKDIYKKLGEPSDVPLSVRGQFFMKSYTFLKSLPAKANCESIINNLTYKSPEIMEFLDDNFVVNVMLKNVDEKFSQNHENAYENGRMIASFILSCKDKEAETRRYELFLAPLLDRNLPLWYEIHDGHYHVKHNLKEILQKLMYYIDDYSLDKKMNLPVQTFINIQSKLESALSPQRDYVFLTCWKLAVEFMRSVEEHKSVFSEVSVEEIKESQSNEKMEKLYAKLHVKIAPSIAKSCTQILKNDLERFPSSVYTLFAKSLEEFFTSFSAYSFIQSAEVLEYFKCILQSSSDREVYLALYRLLPKYLENPYTDIEKERMKEIRKALFSHPSEELKMHYYQLFSESADLDIEK